MNLKKIFTIAVLAFSLVACQSAPDADEVTTTDTQEVTNTSGTSYSIDTTASDIVWIGTKPTGQHEGSFKLHHGTLLVENGEVKGGNFTVNISSLLNKDLEGEMKGKLEGHLKSADFFDAARYPTATFTITDIKPFDSANNESLLPGATHTISGNLKLKDSTKNITFPALVQSENGKITATANFNIDRSQWGMSYGTDKSLQDKFIRPEVNLQLNIKAHTK